MSYFNLGNMHFVGLYCIITLQRTLEKTKKSGFLTFDIKSLGIWLMTF